MAVFPKLAELNRLRNKIRSGQEVSIGVFCWGNGDRSPLAQHAMQEEFKRLGFHNVKIFSFGTSVSPKSHGGPASERTAAYARELGYAGINRHVRRTAEEAFAEIDKADLLLTVSPMHMGYLAEGLAEEYPKKAHEVLMKTWTLKGFANKKEWTLPFDGLARIANRLYRGLSSKDPYFRPKTPEGEREFRKDLDDLVVDAKKAVSRLAPKR